MVKVMVLLMVMVSELGMVRTRVFLMQLKIVPELVQDVVVVMVLGIEQEMERVLVIVLVMKQGMVKTMVRVGIAVDGSCINDSSDLCLEIYF